MSLKTWLEEFYPLDANENMTRIDAVDHSLTKWIGASKDNLKKHDLHFSGTRVTEKSAPFLGFTFGVRSCALCQKFLAIQRNCKNCPIYKFKGEDCINAYNASTNFSNPDPMIELLAKTLDNELE